MARRKEIDRDRVLDAAEKIMIARNGRNFTLDDVAEEAGISKGGLVYTFATKDDLIAEALKRELLRFTRAWHARLQAGPAKSQGPLVAYVEEVKGEDMEHQRLASLLMTALTSAEDATQAARQFYRAIFENFDGSTKRGRNIRQAVLAIEGLFFLQGLGLVQADQEEWESVVSHSLETLQE